LQATLSLRIVFGYGKNDGNPSQVTKLLRTRR